MKKILKTVGKFLKYLIRYLSRTILFLTLIIVIVGIFGSVFLGFKLYPVLMEAKEISYDKLLTINDNTFTGLYDTVIYDNKGEILTEINIGNYEYIDIEDVSDWVTEGYIAVEDQRFKTHNGIDFKGISRAAVDIIKNKGEITQGGSTITQQLIKNNLLTNEKSFKRKFIEFYLAPQVEKQYSKSEILEFYLNTNEYGNNCKGIGSASKYYFSKEPKDLSIAESALLIGVSNNPTAYNPKSRPDKAKEKRDIMLMVMYNQGVIDEKQYQEALDTEIELTLDREPREIENYQVSFAIHSTILKVMELEGFNFKYIFDNKEVYDDYKLRYTNTYNEVGERIRAGGYTIYTSLDNEKQNLLQGILDNKLSGYKEKAEDGRYTMQGSATLINNETGYVEAIVGGRGVDDEFNRGFLAARQPGSAIKPIVVYGVAYDTGKYYPSLKREDKYDDKGPKNWDLAYRGNISLREALGRSINTVAFNLFAEIGAETGLEYMEKLRFSNLSYIDNGNNALSLGGFTYGVTTTELAKAYSTLANYGEYLDNLCVTKIEFQNEGVIYDGEVNSIKVYEPDAAYMVLDSLKANMTESFGLSRGLNVKNAIVGAKSGTTNSQKDAWYSGVSKYYTLTVWCGYDNPKTTGIYGSGIPGKIWNETMTKLHEEKERIDFERPVTITEKDINWKGEYVDYSSGQKDLYSQALIDKADRVRLEKIELARQEREKQDVIVLNGEIDIFSQYEIKDENSIKYIEERYLSLLSRIDKIQNEEAYNQLVNDLGNVYSKLQEDLKPIKDRVKQELLEREKEEQQNIENDIKYTLNEINVIEILTETDINTILGKEKGLEMLISLLTDDEKSKNYTKQLDEIMSLKDVEIEKIKNDIAMEKELKRLQEKNALEKKLQDYLTELNKLTIWTENVELLYSEIEETLQSYEGYGGSINYRNSYNKQKELIDSTKEVEEIEEENIEIND